MATANTQNRRRFETFVILFAAWVILSGHFDALHLGFGAVCAALVAAVSYDLLLPATSPHPTLRTLGRFAGYIPWILWEVFLANLHVAHLVLRPSAMRPQIVRFRTSLTSDLARVTLGNSITLTPGTVTVDIDGDEFCVHALSDKSAEDLRSGDMERRVARLFDEPGPGAGAAARADR
jgi:multicomponent Na+:H+ antiporter subunit E